MGLGLKCAVCGPLSGLYYCFKYNNGKNGVLEVYIACSLCISLPLLKMLLSEMSNIFERNMLS